MDEALDLTSEQAAELAGLTYCQLDHWVRSGVVEPRQHADGCGTARRWTMGQVRLLRMVVTLRELGAPLELCALVAREAELLTEQAWSARVLVTTDGRITTLLGGDSNGYCIDLSLPRVTVAEQADQGLVEDVKESLSLPPPAVARAIREAAHVSQERFAEELGVHRVTVARWEQVGGGRAPRGELRTQYARLLRQLEQVIAS